MPMLSQCLAIAWQLNPKKLAKKDCYAYNDQCILEKASVFHCFFVRFKKRSGTYQANILTVPLKG